MYKRLTTWALAFLFSVSLFGCATLKEYKPKSKEEAAIKNVLVTFMDSAKKGDVQGVSPLLHDDFKAPVGRERKVLSKNEYLEALPQRAAEHPPITMSEPQMNIKGDRADVKCSVTRGNWHGQLVFHLIRDHGKWLITSWEY
ncbi:MAG: nuclear transport factor 2 family protein [Deltaproteobacteria bacterium]|nr:nuclear transport factor 2 family protein [Deltaproteobacteria bacterium]